MKKITEFEEFERQWGVSGMSLDKQRLATAAFKAGMLAAAEILERCPVVDFRDVVLQDIKIKAEEL